MGELLTPVHLMVVAIVAFALFGGKKLPELGEGVGEGLRGFKDGIKGLTDELSSAELIPAVAAKNENNCIPVAHSEDATTSLTIPWVTQLNIPIRNRIVPRSESTQKRRQHCEEQSAQRWSITM